MATCSNEHEKWQTLGPSDALINMFRAEATDPTEEVQSKLNHLLNTFMEAYRSTTTDEKNLVRPEQWCYESKVWYYKILESFLQENDQRPILRNVSRFLEDNPFQCSLVLCCLEITSCTNKQAYHFIPRLLQRFSLAPYIFWKVVNLVLHTQVDLPRNGCEHLLKVVEMIVESLAWTKDSPLWDEIRANEGQLPSCQQVMSPKELEDPMTMEPLDQDQIVNANPTTDQQNSTLKRTQRYSFLYMFARTVYKLLHKRLTTLCSALNLKDELRLKIWTCLEYAVVHHFDMLRDCHLDLLLLCTIHAFNNNTGHELPFKRIMNCYKSMPHKNKHVSKTLLMQGQPDQGDDKRSRFPTPNTQSVDQEDEHVACFYSQVYTPAMGHFVKKFAPTPGAETPPLSPYPTQPSASSRKYRVCDGCNIFVSQLNKQTASPHPAGMRYDFQSSPSQQIRDINTMLKSRGPPVKRGRALQMDKDDTDCNSGPSAKMLPVSLQRRILDVERDQIQAKHDMVEQF